MKNNRSIHILVILTALVFASCDLADKTVIQEKNAKPALKKESVSSMQAKRPVVKQVFDEKRFARGGEMFQEYCFMCHGAKAEGAPNWKTPLENGKYPAPPLDGTGHAWHHPMKVLHDYIKDGSENKGGSMTGFEGALNDEDISDIIAWFQSKWSVETYSSWYWRDQGSKTGMKKF